MTDERSEEEQPWSAGTEEDLSPREIIDDLRAENEQLRAKLRAMDASEARERLRSCTTKDEAERICNGMLATIDFQRAEIERCVTEIDSMVVHQEYEALQIDDLRTDLAANAATIAAQAAAIACAEGIHQQMTAELAAQAAEIERLKENRDYWMAQYERAYELAQSRAKDAELADLRSQLEEQRAKLDATEKLVNMFAQLPSGLPDLPTEPGWIEFRRPREGLPHWRAQKCDFAGGPVTERLRADSFIELALVVDDANWLTPHAEKEARP
jgi:hypothetical protein